MILLALMGAVLIIVFAALLLIVGWLIRLAFLKSQRRQ